jgi:hypothetical protein
MAAVAEDEVGEEGVGMDRRAIGEGRRRLQGKGGGRRAGGEWETKVRVRGFVRRNRVDGGGRIPLDGEECKRIREYGRPNPHASGRLFPTSVWDPHPPQQHDKSSLTIRP